MPGPLAGLKVLDFTGLLPGPYATLMLADMGAEVVKIVSASRPDLTAFLPPFLEDGSSAVFAYLNRGKKSLALNLKHPRAREVAAALAKESDVLVEQFRPGVMDSLGLGYQAMAEVNPALVYCSITGYGQTGPLANRAGHDINYLARSGIMSYSGSRETGPGLLGVQVADLACGSLLAVTGILAALRERDASGRGQWVDISMTDGALALNALAGPGVLAGGPEPGPEGFMLNGGSLYDFYRTSDGGWLSAGCLEPKFFADFCRVLGRPDLEAGSVSPHNLAEVKAEVRRIIAEKPLAHWEEEFRRADACVEPVLGLEEAYHNEHARAREMVVEVPGRGGERVLQPGVAIKFSRTPGAPGPAAAPAGSHTREVLAGLGWSGEDLDELEREGLFS